MRKIQAYSLTVCCALALALAVLAACGAAAAPTETPTEVPTWMPLPSNTAETITVFVVITLTPDATHCYPRTGCTSRSAYGTEQRLATQIIAGATATAALIQTATSQALATRSAQMPIVTPCPADTSCPTLVLDPDQIRATQIILDTTATERASQELPPVPTRNLYSPIPDIELEVLRNLWLDELETAAGFSHPAFDETINDLLHTISFISPRYVRSFHLQPSVVRTEFEGSTYVAVIVTTSFIWAGHSNLLVFRIYGG